MFNAIGNFFREIKINSDFAGCEKLAKQAHLKEAEIQLCCKQIGDKAKFTSDEHRL